MSAAPAYPPALLNFLEVFLSGCCVAIFAAAYVISQGVSYFQNHGKKDKAVFKALVGTCMVLQLAYVIIYMSFTVQTFAVNFGNPVYSLTPNRHLVASNILASIINMLVISFYAWRAWVVLGKNIFIGILGGLLVLFEIGAGCFLSASEALAKDFRTDAHVKIAGPLNLISLCTCDVVLTVLLIIGLIRAKSKGDAQSSGALINRLVLVAIETNFLPTAFQIIALVLWYTTNWGYLAITPCLPTVYVLTLLLWLHARQTTRMNMAGAQSSDNPISRNFNMLSIISHANRSPTSARSGNPFKRGDTTPPHGGLSAVHIATLKEIHVEGGSIDEKAMDGQSMESFGMEQTNSRPWA